MTGFVDIVNSTGIYWDVLHVDAVIEYLMLFPDDGGLVQGISNWITDRAQAKARTANSCLSRLATHGLFLSHPETG